VHREIKENLETANVSSPELNATFPLAEVPRAHAMLDANEQIGKVRYRGTAVLSIAEYWVRLLIAKNTIKLLPI